MLSVVSNSPMWIPKSVPFQISRTLTLEHGNEIVTTLRYSELHRLKLCVAYRVLKLNPTSTKLRRNPAATVGPNGGELDAVARWYESKPGYGAGESGRGKFKALHERKMQRPVFGLTLMASQRTLCQQLQGINNITRINKSNGASTHDVSQHFTTDSPRKC